MPNPPDPVDVVLQRGLFVTYAVASLAGVAAALYTPPSMEDSIGGSAANLWGAFLLGGGLFCLFGTLVPRGVKGDWFGEYVGLWPVTAAVAVYAGAALSTVGTDPGRTAGSLLLFVLTTLLVVRWFRVRDDARKARIRDQAAYTYAAPAGP